MRQFTQTIMSVALVVLLAIVYITTACQGNSGGKKPTTANMRASIKDEVGSSSDVCEARIILTFEPVKLTGSDGKSVGFTVDKTIKASGGPSLDNGRWTCFYNMIVTPPGLRTGVWRIRAQLGNWSTQCERDLKAGNNNANFTLGRQGCSSPGYP